MALTTTITKQAFVPQHITVTEATFSNSYPSEGEVFTAATAGLQALDFADVNIIHGDEAKSTEQYISGVYYEKGKLHAVNAKTGKEVEAGKNLEKLKVQVISFGRARAK